MAKRSKDNSRKGEAGRRERPRDDAHRDPITGTPGAHPVGTGLGAAGGGLAGAGIGGVAGGPVGAAIGAAIGAVAGGLAGKGVAETIEPTYEDEYWRGAYASRPYVEPNTPYENYQPAYRYGWESYSRAPEQRFEDVESDLRRDWDQRRGSSNLDWDRARHAVRDAWDRVASRFGRR